MSAPGGRAEVFRQNADIGILMSECRGCPAGRVWAGGGALLPDGQCPPPRVPGGAVGRVLRADRAHGMGDQISLGLPQNPMVTIRPYQLS